MSPLITRGHYDELHAVLVSIWAGGRYGAKIRLPHALIMTFLFKRDMSTRRKLRTAWQLVLEHASNLASFAAVYKILLFCLKWTSRRLQSPHVSGASAGFLRRLGPIILSTIGKQPLFGLASTVRNSPTTDRLFPLVQ
jgi:hypothetical protein